MEDFVHLHVHTHYSILDGQSKVPHLVDKAIKDGMKGMAITDHGVMYGIKEFSDYCAGVNKQRKADGLEPFKPIFGCEMYVAHHRKEDKNKDAGDKSGYHLIVLAKNYHGYKNLIKLVSRAWTDGYYYRPRTDRYDLEKYHEDLIVCSACIAGEVPAKILKGDCLPRYSKATSRALRKQPDGITGSSAKTIILSCSAMRSKTRISVPTAIPSPCSSAPMPC